MTKEQKDEIQGCCDVLYQCAEDNEDGDEMGEQIDIIFRTVDKIPVIEKEDQSLEGRMRQLLKQDAFEGIKITIDAHSEDEIRWDVNSVSEIFQTVNKVAQEWVERNKGFWLDPMNSVNVGLCYILNDDEGWWIELPARFVFDIMGWDALAVKMIEDPNKKEVIK